MIYYNINAILYVIFFFDNCFDIILYILILMIYIIDLMKFIIYFYFDK